MEQSRNLQWYAKELGMTHLAARIDDTLKIAMEQGWNLEQTLHALFEGEYERRLVGRQKARIRTAGFTQIKYLGQQDSPCPDLLINDGWLIFSTSPVISC